MPNAFRKRLRFPDTPWSKIGRAAASDEVARQQALAELLTIYTPALRSFIVKSRHVPADLADDLLHDFVADKILGRKLLCHVDRGRGKFRNYLLKALNNFVTTKLRRKYATRAVASGLDVSEVADATSQQQIDKFDQEWVQQVVRDALGQMQADCTERSRMDIWKVFCLRVVDPMLHGAEPVDYGEIVRKFKVQTPRQAINLLATAKRCFVRHLRTAVGRYAFGKNAIDTEIADLREIVGR
jgi:DNA-directed RNA polymerase specialized sigma24 family protein